MSDWVIEPCDIPWDVITRDPAQFIPSGCMPVDIPFNQPSKMPGFQTQIWYAHLMKGQSSKGVSFRFNIPDAYEPPHEEDDDDQQETINLRLHADSDSDEQDKNDEYQVTGEISRAESVPAGRQLR